MTTSNAPDWHTDAFPELRAARPWVMQEMIESEPELTRRMADAAEPAAAEIAQRVVAAARAREPIVVTGCGTSEHGAMAIALLVEHGLRALDLPAVVEPRQALEASIDPRAGGVCIAVSHDGGTRATLLAVEAAADAGTWTAAITANGEGSVPLRADIAMVTPLTDRSWCHTVAYLSAILAGEAIRAAITETAFEAAALSEYVERCLGLRPDAEAAAHSLHGTRTLVTHGSGPDYVAARELALKIEEAARVPAYGYALETLLHGHLVAHDDRDGAVLIVTDLDANERVLQRAKLSCRALNRLGMKVAAILSPVAAQALPEDLTPAGRIVLPPSDGLPSTAASLTGSALALQLLTLSLVHEAGVNPDLIRREEAPWREASAVAEGEEY
jgi:fructoselysine-6-P-deglycase FrlB-like protein